MNFNYNFLFVTLSVAVAIQASYVGLNLARLIPAAFASNRRRLIAGSTLSLAVGIWGMHFIGMLAVITPIKIDYAVLPTLISFLVCVLVTGVAIYLASLRAWRFLIIASVIMGLGISSMHYIGMLALHSSVHMGHDPIFALASVVIAIVASALALWLAFAVARQPPLWLSATVLGGAISGMHYMAMAGTTLHAMPGPGPTGQAISSDYLAVVVSVVAFSISGIFMLALVPVENNGALTNEQWKPNSRPEASAASHPPPQDGGDQASGTVEPPGATIVVPDEVLPVERNRSRRHIAYREIVSVHANAHYTYIFNGSDDLFCPLTITEIAERLPDNVFFRTHRSYIVNLAHVTSVKKAANAGIAEIDSPVRRTVPISRSRIAALKESLIAFQEKSGAAAADSRPLPIK